MEQSIGNSYHNRKVIRTAISDSKIIIPLEEDNYFYEMIAEWENGSKVSYVFSVEYTD